MRLMLTILLAMLITPIFQPLKASDIAVTTQMAEKAKIVTESGKEDHVTITLRCFPNFISGKENVVEVTVRNDGDNSIEYSADNPLNDITFDVKNEGSTVSPTLLYRSISNDETSTPGVKPLIMKKGEELKVIVNFTRYFDLSVVGTYKISAVWSGRISGTDKIVTVKTKPLAVVVKIERPTPLAQ